MLDAFLAELSISTSQYVVTFADNAPRYISALVIFLLFWLIARLQKYISVRVVARIESKTAKTLSILFARITRFILLSIGVVVSLSLLGVDWGALITGLGLVGFGVSFAFKDYIENFLAGVIILTQKPFEIGDQVKVRDTHGTVQQIATRYTIIKDFDGKQVILPNSDMLSSSIERHNAYGRRRYTVDIFIDINADVSFALNEGVDLVRKTVGVLTKPSPRAVVTDTKDGRIAIRYFFWAHPREQYELAIRSHLQKNLLRLFQENGIEIGYDTSIVLSGHGDIVKKNPDGHGGAQGGHFGDGPADPS
jgi:small-conductance mechanosensitive channel